MKENQKFSLQESEYRFPYHYLPSLNSRGALRLHRKLTWGLDYMTYMTFVHDLVRKHGPTSLLDVGCGDGRLISMVKAYIPDVMGIDLSDRAIAFARAFNPDVPFVCGPVSTVKAQYAFVTLIEVLEHIRDSEMQVFLKHIAEIVGRDGRVLISVPTVNVPLTEKHYRHYDLGLLQATIDPCFEIEQHWWLYRRCFLERRIRRVLCNGLCVLDSPFLLALIWQLHRRVTYHADSRNAAHLLCIAKARSRGMLNHD